MLDCRKGQGMTMSYLFHLSNNILTAWDAPIVSSTLNESIHELIFHRAHTVTAYYNHIYDEYRLRSVAKTWYLAILTYYDNIVFP